MLITPEEQARQHTKTSLLGITWAEVNSVALSAQDKTKLAVKYTRPGTNYQRELVIHYQNADSAHVGLTVFTNRDIPLTPSTDNEKPAPRVA